MDISKYWKTIIDTLQDGLLVIDPAGTIQAANPAAEELTGYAAEELIGSSCMILNCTGCDVYGRGSAEQWCKLFADGDVRAKQCLITHKTRKALNIVKSATVLRDENGQVIGAVETLRDISEIIHQQDEIANLRKTLHMEDGYHGILGKSPPMQRLFEMIDNVALSDAPVMIHGDSGTGKEMVARAIHVSSPRNSKPFIKVNCAALNENLLESELFGHVKGAFTGADRTRMGRFEAADEGSIFLDEIGDIPLSTQVKLLRVLEERELERVGDHTPIPVNVRIITATHKDIEEMISQKQFRDDLFFRINVFPLHCPGLAQRREDIPIIVQSFIRHNNEKSGKQISGLTPEAIEKLTAYPWPGNVRELRNAIDYAFVLCSRGEISAEHLPPRIAQAVQGPAPRIPEDPSFEAERQSLIDLLRSVKANQSEAARILGVSRVTIWKRIKKYGIDLLSDLR